MRLHETAASLVTFLLPSPCLACERPTGTGRPLLGLCVPCRGRLRSPRSACIQCGSPIASPDLPDGFRCGACRRAPPAFDRLQTLFLYQPPLDAVVRGLKFGRLAYLGRQAAELLCAYHVEKLATTEVVVPLPLHWRRRLARGYNQADEIATPLARLLGRRRSFALRRGRATQPQAELDRNDRLTNPRDAFRVTRSAAVAGRRVLLIDDVVTTGATAGDAAAALKAAGAASVTVAVLGRTPPPGAAVPSDGANLQERRIRPWQES